MTTIKLEDVYRDWTAPAIREIQRAFKAKMDEMGCDELESNGSNRTTLLYGERTSS